MKKLLAVVLLALAAVVPAFGQGPSTLSRVGAKFVASNYFTLRAQVVSGNTTTGSVSIIVGPVQQSLQDGRQVQMFQTGVLNPIIIDLGSNNETVTPTAVTIGGCPSGTPTIQNCATITGTFNNAHGNGATVVSGSAGFDEAYWDAALNGGGLVVVDQAWTAIGGTDAMIRACPVHPKVAAEDDRTFAVQYWTPTPGATTLAAPATLTAVTALPSATPVGAFGTGTYHILIAYVDMMGQEGPSSADFSEAGLATGSFIFSPPAASTGAVGYTIYIGLTAGGSATIVYKVPLVTQPTVLGAAPVGNGVCVLTTIETTTPACAVTNTAFNQTGTTATVTAITLNTSPLAPQSSIVSTTAITIPNAGGRTTYALVPGSHVGVAGLPSNFLPFAISGSAASTVPTVLGTIDLPPGFMNFVGRTIRVCGRAGITTGSTTTIASISFQWDAMGQDTAGLGVTIGSLGLTPATAFATTEMDNFCEDFITTVAAATATGGSIRTAGGFIATSGVATAAAGQGAGGDALTAAVGSLNLAVDARINIVYTHTTGTFAPTLQNLSVTVLN